jgi:DHA3 family tetracycline resistance protein-like MFS transporter
MFISGGLFVVFSIFLLIFMPENEFSPIPMEDKNTWQKMGHTFMGGLKAIKKSTVLMSILGIALLYGLYSEGIDRLWGAHFLEDLTFPAFANLKPAVWFGIISTTASILGIIAVEIVKRRMEKTGKMDRMWVLVIVNMLLIGSLFAFGLSGNFAFGFAAYLAVSTFRRINEPIYRAWMNQGIESNVRATVLSTMGQIDAFGQIIGGVIIGFIAKQISISAGIVAGALILCPVMLLYILAINKNKNTVQLTELERE